MLLNPKKLPAEPEVDPNGCCVSMETDALKAPECVCVSVGECEGCIFSDLVHPFRGLTGGVLVELARQGEVKDRKLPS